MPTRARFHPVNPTAIRSLRRQLGWSQAELGKRAGYCERVIRKAEAGGSLSIHTIENLVQTFVTHNLPITTRELIYSEDTLAQRFLSSYDSHGKDMLQHCASFLTDDFVFSIPAEKSVLQVAGEYVGQENFQTYLNLFFTHFTRKTDPFEPTYLTARGRVVAHFDERLEFMGVPLPSIWVNLHFYFRGGQISRVDAQFDYALCLASIDRIRQDDGRPGREYRAQETLQLISDSSAVTKVEPAMATNDVYTVTADAQVSQTDRAELNSANVLMTGTSASTTNPLVNPV